MTYYRQKILLALLEVFNGRLTAKQLQKLLFLATRHQDIKSYDFVPYYYGCFSFQANQDVLTLYNKNILQITETPNGRYISIDNGTKTQCDLFGDTQFLSQLKSEDKQIILQLKSDFGSMSQNQLIRFTYINYPFYAIKSKIAKDILTTEELIKISQQKRHYTEPYLFTIGYEGHTLESYLKVLILKDIQILCDVRKNAYSQKYGFSKSILEKACIGVGIKYIHIPALGIESNKRSSLDCQADYDRLFNEYENTTLRTANEQLNYIVDLLHTEKRIALTCFEKDPKQCHRTRVANAIVKLTHNKIPFISL